MSEGRGGDPGAPESSAVRPAAEVAAVMAVGLLTALLDLPVPVVLPMVVAASLLLWLRGDGWVTVGLHAGPRPLLHLALGLALGGAALAADLWLLGPMLEAVTGRSVEWGTLPPAPGQAEFAIQLVILAWASAMAAEMVFRGYLITRLSGPLGGDTAAVVASALAYGAAVAMGQDGTLGEALGGFTVGVGYGLLYLAAGRNLILPIACHGALDTAHWLLVYLAR